MAVIILVESRHALTEPQALALRQAYADSNPISITADVVRWQRERYGSDLSPAEFGDKTDGHQIIEILTQMLWEARKQGREMGDVLQPWPRFQGFAIGLSA